VVRVARGRPVEVTVPEDRTGHGASLALDLHALVLERLKGRAEVRGSGPRLRVRSVLSETAAGLVLSARVVEEPGGAWWTSSPSRPGGRERDRAVPRARPAGPGASTSGPRDRRRPGGAGPRPGLLRRRPARGPRSRCGRALQVGRRRPDARVAAAVAGTSRHRALPRRPPARGGAGLGLLGHHQPVAARAALRGGGGTPGRATAGGRPSLAARAPPGCATAPARTSSRDRGRAGPGSVPGLDDSVPAWRSTPTVPSRRATAGPSSDPRWRLCGRAWWPRASPGHPATTTPSCRGPSGRLDGRSPRPRVGPRGRRGARPGLARAGESVRLVAAVEDAAGRHAPAGDGPRAPPALSPAHGRSLAIRPRLLMVACLLALPGAARSALGPRYGGDLVVAVPDMPPVAGTRGRARRSRIAARGPRPRAPCRDRRRRSAGAGPGPGLDGGRRRPRAAPSAARDGRRSTTGGR
jgi:hypothetical protein